VLSSGGNGSGSNWIESRYPDGGSVNSKNANLTITFNRDMNTSVQIVVTGESHTAGDPASFSSFWSDNRTFNFLVYGPMSGGGGTVVQLLSSFEGFQDSVGNFLPEGTVLWQFNYAYDPAQSYSISGTVDRSSGTDEGEVILLVYDHQPSSYDDLSFIDMATKDASSLPVPSALPTKSAGLDTYLFGDLGNGSNYYVTAWINVFGASQWYHGYPTDQYGPITLSSTQSGVALDLTAAALTIESRNPALNATSVPDSQTLSITFNNAIRPTSLATIDVFAFGPSHEAGIPTLSALPTLSTDLRTILMTVEAWLLGSGETVHLIATGSPKLLDVNADSLAGTPDIWKYELERYSISGSVNGGTTTRTAYAVISTTQTPSSPADFVGSAEGTGSSVAYNIGGLSPGSYYVFAWRDEDGSGFTGGPNTGDIVGVTLSPLTVPPNRTGINVTVFLPYTP